MPKQRWIMFSAIVLCLLHATNAQAQRTKDQFREHKIVVYGDSFTAGDGLPQEESYPMILRGLINEKFNHDRIEVINAGISGDTAATGLRRVSTILAEKPTIVIIAFGPEDALRTIEPNITYNALDQMLQTLTYNNIYVLLLGMQASAESDIEFATRFNALFLQLAKRYQVAYVPNFLKGVQDDPYHLQHNGIYPNERGTQIIAQTLTDPLRKMLRNLNDRRLR